MSSDCASVADADTKICLRRLWWAFLTVGVLCYHGSHSVCLQMWPFVLE
jgi:hypothetical protein